MPSMNIELTDNLANLVAQRVESGLYVDASEVVQEALRLMVQRDREVGPTIEMVQQKLRRGLEQAERCEFVDKSVSEIVAELRSADQQ